MRLALLSCAALCATACCPEGYISRDAIAPSVEAIVDRHDLYLEADPALTALEREALLGESALLLHLVNGDLSAPVPAPSN